jgi:hypothetical protein
MYAAQMQFNTPARCLHHFLLRFPALLYENALEPYGLYYKLRVIFLFPCAWVQPVRDFSCAYFFLSYFINIAGAGEW